MQDLFYGTLGENISVGKEDVKIEDMLWAIEQVGLNDYFKHLPKGLNSMILPEGQGLSTSIKQKIILARTLAEKPKMIIMDDTLHGLDYQDRKNISEILTNPEADWTLLAVSKDPLMLDRSDKVITMEKGQIVDVKERTRKS